MSTLFALALLSLLTLVGRAAGATQTYVDFSHDVTFSPADAWQTGALDMDCAIANVAYSTSAVNASVQFEFMGAHTPHASCVGLYLARGPDADVPNSRRKRAHCVWRD